MNKIAAISEPFVAIEGRVLHHALKPLIYIVQRRSTYPVLQTVRLSLGRDGLRLTGTDLNVEISTLLDVNAAGGEFELCIDARTLSSISRAAGVADITMRKIEKVIGHRQGKPETETNFVIELDEGSVRYEIENTLNADSFPEFPGKRGALIENFTNGHLSDSLRRCERYISDEETRYYLNGVYWVRGEQGREFVATDGHRLVRYRYTTESGDGVGRIIPAKTVRLLSRFFAGRDATVYEVGENKIEVVTDGYTIRSKLIEGTYPDYRRVIPKDEGAREFRFTKAGLASMLSRLGGMPMRERRYGRALHFHAESGLVAVKHRNPDSGSALVRSVFEWPEGAPDFGLNARYLADNLATCDSDVRLLVKDGSSPILILDGDDSVTRVQMPMRV